MENYKYLTYSIDKHQSNPTLRNDFPQWLRDNCDDGYDVVVNLRNGKCYYRGEWENVDVVKKQEK